MAVCGAWLIATALLLTPQRLAALDQDELLLSPHDDPGRVTHQVLRLASRPWPPGGSAILVGPSSMREALSSTEDLAQKLSAPMAIHDLSGRGLTPIEDVAILDALPDGLWGVVVWTVSPIALSKVDPVLYEHLRRRSGLALGFVSDQRDAELAALGIDVPRRVGIYAWDTRTFLLQRLALPLRTTDPVYRRHRTRRSTDPAANRREVSMKLRSLGRALPVGLDLIDRALDRLAVRSRSVAFVLLEQTQDRDQVEGLVGHRALARYQRGIDALVAERTDTIHVDPNDGLVSDDFADLVHLYTDRGRRRFTADLAQAIDRSRTTLEAP